MKRKQTSVDNGMVKLEHFFIASGELNRASLWKVLSVPQNFKSRIPI